MDEIMDSIRNCSLDVDADSTDFSDTSANFNSPTAFNVITNQLTSKIDERFEIPQLTLQQTALAPTNEIAIASSIKKPSYLNLACCVNGYSYLTTYDSKLRQNINNSREVSPIRPASNIIHCKGTGTLLTTPGSKSSAQQYSKQKRCGYAMENQSLNPDDSDTTITVTNGKYLKENNFKNGNIIALTDETEQASKTFIQQRVERLYGVEAISKGFYSPKNSRFTHEKVEKSVLCERSTNSVKLNAQNNKIKDDEIKNELQNKDLPVFRHLRPEFRAQLPISPTKATEDNIKNMVNVNNDSLKSCPMLSEDIPDCNTITKSLNLNQNNLNKSNNMEYNFKNIKIRDSEIISNLENINDTLQTSTNNKTELNNKIPAATVNTEIKSNNITDGKYFIEILRSEQSRLLCLASTAENEMEELIKNPAISEDILGLYRAAAGKARLLVSQKMKQFEGLCLKNLNPKSDDKFVTTISDLLGFWDMVKLQIDHIDTIFKELQFLKENDWKRSDDSVCLVPSGSKLIRRPVTSANSKNRKINPNDKVSSEANGVHVNKSNSSAIAAQKREMQRKQLMDFKRKNKIALETQQQNSENTSDIITNEIIS